MEKVGEDYATGGGRQPGIDPVIQVGGTGSRTVLFRVMGNARRDDEGGGSHPHGVPLSDNREAGEASGVCYVKNVTKTDINWGLHCMHIFVFLTFYEYLYFV